MSNWKIRGLTLLSILLVVSCSDNTKQSPNPVTPEEPVAIPIPADVPAAPADDGVPQNIPVQPVQCSEECLKEKVTSGQIALVALNEHIDLELTPLHESYSNEYQTYLNNLRENIYQSDVHNHELLLNSCEEFYEICNQLERAAILKHSIEWLDSKIQRVTRQKSELDQNIWKIEKKLELSAVADTQEQEEINQLITSTDVLLEENITPPEAQDLAKIEQELFDTLLFEGRDIFEPEPEPEPEPEIFESNTFESEADTFNPEVEKLQFP